MEQIEKTLDKNLQEDGINLIKRLALRTLIFDRPKLYPSSWSDQKWESFKQKNIEIITQMKSFVLYETVESE